MASDALPAFLAAMAAAGVHPVEPIAQPLASGKLVRFRAQGDGPGRQNGWAVLHCEGAIPAGAFGHYRLGVHESWRAGHIEQLAPQERRERARAWREERARREAEQLAEWERVAGEGLAWWNRARPAASDHPYLARKGIAAGALRQSSGWLLVPMRDGEGRLWNLQRIGGDGTKRFLKGGRTAGLYWTRGQPRGVLCIGEGFATMAAVHRATGHAVAAAFSAKNLEPVAVTLRSRWPAAEIILCADDDAHLPNNIGVASAQAAARAVDGRVAMPPQARD